MASYLRSALNSLGLDDGPPQQVYHERERDDSGMVGRVLTVADKKYRVLKQIAEGGFAYVFMVQETVTGNTYALKRLIVPDKERLRLAQQEIEIMQLGAQHPAIVKLVSTQTLSSRETGHNNAEVLIVMELCPGSLIHILNERMRGFEVHDVMRMFEPIVSAVGFLHQQSPPIIHRDLKVENILVAATREVRLCDFGSATRRVLAPKTSAEIAQAEDEIQLNTTPQYRAPEMWDLYSRMPIDVKSDVWALGCMLYKLCYYRTPYDDGSKMAICNADLKLPSNAGPHVVYHDLLKRILVKDPRERPTAAQVLEDLQQIKKKLGPRPPGPDVLDVPPIEIETNGPAQTSSSGMQRKLMGAIRNVKTMVDQQLGGAVPSHQSQSQSQSQPQPRAAPAHRHQPPPDMDYSCITPRLIAMKVPSVQAIEQMHSFLETKYTGSYFIWNLSDAEYPTRQFGDRVRHVTCPKKGGMDLDVLFELCESIEAWLTADRAHVAVVHCTNGAARTGLAMAAYTVYTGLFTTGKDACAHFSAHWRAAPPLRASTRRQVEYLAKVMRGDVQPRCAVVASVSFPALPVFSRQPVPPFAAIQHDGHTIFSSRDRPATVQDGQLVTRCGQVVDGDLVIILASPQTDRTAVPICQLYENSCFLKSGVRRYMVEDLDKPVKSLGQEFYVELSVEASDQPSSAKQPWKNPQRSRPNPLTTCFFSDAEARDCIRSYERELGIRIDRPSRGSAPATPPTRNASTRTEQNSSAPRETPKINSLIDFGAELSAEAEQPAAAARKSATPPVTAPADTTDLLGFDASDVATPTPPDSHQATESDADPFGIMSDVHSASASTHGDLFGLDPFSSAMHKSASATLLDENAAGGLPRSASAANIMPLSASPRPGAQPMQRRADQQKANKPFDPFEQLVGGIGQAASQPQTQSQPQVQPMLQQPRPSPASAQANYRVNTGAFTMSPTTQSPRPQKHDPFGDLGGMKKGSPQPQPSTGGRSPGGPSPAPAAGPPRMGGAMGGSQAAWQQQQRAAQQRQAQEQLQRAAQQRQNQALEQQRKRAQDMEKNRWTKNAQGGGGFDDLLAEHNFTPTQRDKGPVSINSMREEVLLANDTDGSTALRLKVNSWTDGKKGNIRALLSTLQDVLWEEAEWEPVNISELLKAVQVKKAFMRAALVIHPDKVVNDEHEPLARLIFDELNKAYTAFKEAGMPSLG